MSLHNKSHSTTSTKLPKIGSKKTTKFGSAGTLMASLGSFLKSIWRLKYRFYSILVLMIITPIIGASGANAREEVSPNIGFEVASENLLASLIERDQGYKTAFATIGEPEQILVVDNLVYLYDRFGNSISSGALSDGFASQYLSGIPAIDFQKREKPVEVAVINKDFVEPPVEIDLNSDIDPKVEPEPNPNNGNQTPASQPKPSNQANNQVVGPAKTKTNPSKSVEQIVPKPKQAVRTNWVSYPKYKIQVPLIYTNYGDLYNKKADGSINFSSPKEQGSLNSPVQQKLKGGVVHLAYSPLPGEVGNSYIVGHSSNFSSVKSAYNRIFKPIESISRAGEEFFVYDKDGRELKFCVFDALNIAEDDVKEAFKSFGDRRVVTLQTSILGIRNGKVEATNRWLTRGELCN